MKLKNIFKHISTALYLLINLVAFTMSMVFLTSREFFPYHAEASGMIWSEIPSGLQLVLLSLIRLAGFGWLVFALGLGFLIIYCYHIRNDVLSYFTIPALIFIYFSGVFGITYYVYIQTHANTPWTSSIGMIITDIIAFACSMISWRLSKAQHKVTQG